MCDGCETENDRFFNGEIKTNRPQSALETIYFPNDLNPCMHKPSALLKVMIPP